MLQRNIVLPTHTTANQNQSQSQFQFQINKPRHGRRAKIKRDYIVFGVFFVSIFFLVLGVFISFPFISSSSSSTSLSDGEPKSVIQQIYDGDLNLVEIIFSKSSSSGNHGTGRFCKLNFASQLKSPDTIPMFRDLVRVSGCDPKSNGKRNAIHSVDIDEVIAFASSQLSQQHPDPHDRALHVQNSIKPFGVAFHQSRVGSTLISNLMTVTTTESLQNRVYSESSPPSTAVRQYCGLDGCDTDGLATVFFVMGLGSGRTYGRNFFKFQSILCINMGDIVDSIDAVTSVIGIPSGAAPSSHLPFVFVYRDPVEVMMSHFKDGANQPNCARGKSHPNEVEKNLLRDKSANEVPAGSLSTSEFCAAHLASLGEYALLALGSHPEHSRNGLMINYHSERHGGLVESVLDTLIPNFYGFGKKKTEAWRERLEVVGGFYSKARGTGSVDFEHDSEKKQEGASDEIRRYAAAYMEPTFNRLVTEEEEKRLQLIVVA